MTSDPNKAPDNQPEGLFAKRRSIRSFVIREGRITRAQQQALESAWPEFGLEYQTTPLNLDNVFGANQRPRTLEIGFGDGEAMVALAERFPEQDFIGIEVHRPGVGHLLMRIQKLGLTNVRVINHDAMDVFEHMLQIDSLDRVNIYFPDPWPKKRHHKRRIIQLPFLDVLASRLKPNGLVHLATDWEAYAEHMLETLNASSHFSNTVPGEGLTLEQACVPRPEVRPLTKFERRGHRKGHGVWDLVFTRNI